MTDGVPTATGRIEIAASPQRVYDLVTDLAAMAEIAEETAALKWRRGSTAEPGAVFRGTNRNGWRRWTTTCTVTDAEPGRRFAFEVRHTGVPIARWQYDIEADGTGCTVTESTWDRRPSWFAPLAGRVTGTPDRDSRNTRHIEATLKRLKEHAENATTVR